MKIKQMRLAGGLTSLLIGVITLSGCNSGNGNSTLSSKRIPSELSESETAGTLMSPFDSSRGYDSIHERMVDDSCFQRGGAEIIPDGPSGNGPTLVPASWQISENSINEEQYFYAENMKSVMVKLGLALSTRFHDSSNAIIEKEKLNIADKIRTHLSDQWSFYGINLYGVSTRQYTVSYKIHSNLQETLDATGLGVESSAISKYPNSPQKQYEYFVERCGDHLVSSWGYYSFVLAHMSIMNLTQDLRLAINDDTSGSGSDGTGIGDIGGNAGMTGHAAVSGLLNSLVSGTEMQWDIVGTGNMDTASPNICSTTNASACNEEVVEPFFQSISDWTSENKRAKTTSGINTMPIPGQSYLPASAWNGQFGLYDIRPEIQLLFNAPSAPNANADPKLFMYASIIRKINNLSDVAKSYLATVTSMINSHYCKISFKNNYHQLRQCMNDIEQSKDSLQRYIDDVAYTSGTKVVPLNGGSPRYAESYIKLQNYCLPMFGGDFDSDICHSFLLKYIQSGVVPYKMLLNYQNQTQNIELIRGTTESPIATLRYRFKSYGDDANEGGIVYSFLRGDTNPRLWGGNQINPQYLVSEYGDFTASFLDKLGNPYNLFVGNGYLGVNLNKSNSLYVIPGGYSTPLNHQNIRVFMIGNTDLNLDGYFLSGGDIKIYQSVRFDIPSQYIYAECKLDCPATVEGYLLIVSKNLNLYEYQVNKDYSLHLIWTVSNNKLNLADKMLRFSSSTGLLTFSDATDLSTANNSVVNNVPSYSNPNLVPEDGVRRYALLLSSATGALEIYKYGNPTPVWSNKSELTPATSEDSNPTNINQDSFWYNYQIESPE